MDRLIAGHFDLGTARRTQSFARLVLSSIEGASSWRAPSSRAGISAKRGVAGQLLPAGRVGGRGARRWSAALTRSVAWFLPPSGRGAYGTGSPFPSRAKTSHGRTAGPSRDGVRPGRDRRSFTDAGSFRFRSSRCPTWPASTATRHPGPDICTYLLLHRCSRLRGALAVAARGRLPVQRTDGGAAPAELSRSPDSFDIDHRRHENGVLALCAMGPRLRRPARRCSDRVGQRQSARANAAGPRCVRRSGTALAVA